jgi:hypothetical protein
MNPELEALIKAYEAVIESRGSGGHARSQAILDSLLDALLDHHPRFDRQTVQRVVREGHRRWVIAQRQPPTLPPKA